MSEFIAVGFFIIAAVAMLYWLGGAITVVQGIRQRKLEAITVIAFLIVTGFIVGAVYAGMSFL